MRVPTVTADLSQLVTNDVDSLIGRQIKLSKEESHHINTVLRLKSGDKVILLCPTTTRRFEGAIAKVNSEYYIELLNEDRTKTHFRSPVYVLMFALCKGEKNDLVAEKACELGVSKLIFWHANRSVVKLKDKDDITKKLSRWNKITLSAAKQCGTYLCTSVSYEPDLEKAVQFLNACDTPIDRKLVCSLEEGTEQLRDLQLNFSSSVLVVGPEGGLAPKEIDQLIQHGFSQITLGPLTLRAETAAISAVASLNALLGFRELDPAPK